MNNELISIIVPVYNVEKYLEKCVYSLINQTYKNIEILLVNDGSTDSSGTLAEKLANLDGRIKVLHKKNGGLSDARNYGIERANGIYLGFIDSDDYVDPDMYEVLYRNIKKDNSDISMCGLYNIYVNKQDRQVENIETILVSKQDAIKIVLDGKLTTISAVNKLYKKVLFDNLRYDTGCFYEDAFIIVKILDKCNKVSITNERKYYYYHRSNSITTQSFSKKHLDIIAAWKQNFNIVKEKYPEILENAKYRVYWANFTVLDLICMSNSMVEFKDLADSLAYELKKDYLFILKEGKFPLSRKIMLLSLFIGFFPYSIAVKLFKRKSN